MQPSPLRHAASAFLTLCLLVLATAAQAADTGREWIVVTVSGEVRVAGHAAVAAEDRLEAPFAVRTGPDGELRLARGEDRIGIGPGTEIEIEAPERDEAGPVTRIRQALGSALYQVRHRLRNAFEVHTPHLVSVVKGTSFNILATPTATTVALVEGRLLVRTPDAAAEVFLDPGQAAIRSAGDEVIRVEDQREVSAPVRGPIRIARADAQAPAAAPQAGALAPGAASDDGAAAAGDGISASADIGWDAGPAGTSWPAEADVPGKSVATGADTSLETDAALALNTTTTLGAGLDGTIGNGIGAQIHGAELAIDSGGLEADIGAGLSAGADAGLEVGIGAGIDAGVGPGITAGLDAGIGADIGGDLAADVGLDIDADIGVGSGSDLTAGIGAGIGTDLGNELGMDLAADVGVDIGPDLDIEADVDIDLGIIEVGGQVDGGDLVGSVTDTVGDTLDGLGDAVTGTGSGLLGTIGGLFGR